MIRRGYVATPEGQVHYVTDGDADPLLLLHQFPRSARMFVKLIPLLANESRVIAMDTLGCGNSDPPPPAVRISDMARCCVHFLDSLGITKCHIVGVHMGGGIGAELAAECPERVGSLILFGYPLIEEDAE